MRRTLLRLATTSSLVLTVVVGGFPAATPSFAVPETVLERVAVPPRALLPQTTGRPIRLADDGALNAVRASRTSAVRLCSPVWFTALGMTWDQQAGGPIQARVATTRDGVSFGRPYPLDAESGPDPASAEYSRGSSASSLLWTGGGWCALVALDLPAGTALSSLEVLFINASGSSEGPATAPPAMDPSSETVPAAGLFAPSSAAAMTRQPRFVTRQQWGANPNLMNCRPDVAPEVKAGFIHHTAGTNHYSRAAADDIVRSIYAYHTRGRGWCDIAYNFLVDRFGRAYEGRSGGITEPVIGAAQQGFNTGAFSVSLMGTFTHSRPRPAMMRELRRVLAWRLDVAHVPPAGRAKMTSAGGSNTRYEEGKNVKLPVISLHRTTGYTDCPGRGVVSRIDRIRKQVANMGLPKIYRPTVVPDLVRPGSEDLHITATGSRALEWRISVLDPQGEEIASLPRESGTRLSTTWRRSDPPGYPTTPGVYSILVEAAAQGHAARDAVLPFRVRSA